MSAWAVNPGTGATTSFAPEQRDETFASLPPEFYAKDLAYEIHTDKSPVKWVPCMTCRRACLVTTFYVPAWMKGCRACKGEGNVEKGTVAVPQAGRTDPAKAINLRDCLINKGLDEFLCPIDPGHGTMELKSVAHNDNYGPYEMIGYDKGKPVYEMSTGETVMHQCNTCLCVVSASTTHMNRYRRKNEVRNGGAKTSTWGVLLGVREDDE